MIESEKISVIIPVYNVEPYLGKCLDSLCNQTYRNIEIIAVDDGSTDNSGQICDIYSKRDSRVHVIHQENGGLSSARNRGLETATGAYIGFVDSDDWVGTEMYETLLSVLQDQEADIAACGLQFFPSDSRGVLPDGRIMLYNSEEALGDILTNGNLRFEVWNKLYRKKCIGTIRFKKNQIHEDIFFTTQVLFRSSRTAFVNKPFYHYLQKRDGNTNSAFKENRLSVFEEFDALIRELKSREMENNAQRAEILRMIFLLSFYKMATDYHDTPKALIQALLERFDEYYPSLKDNPHFSEIRLKTWLFRVNPRLYYRLAKKHA